MNLNFIPEFCKNLFLWKIILSFALLLKSLLGFNNIALTECLVWEDEWKCQSKLVACESLGNKRLIFFLLFLQNASPERCKIVWFLCSYSDVSQTNWYGLLCCSLWTLQEASKIMSIETLHQLWSALSGVGWEVLQIDKYYI